MIEVKKKDGEAPAALLFRFIKKVRQGGIMKETRHRRFKNRVKNRRKRRLSAIYKSNKAREVVEMKKRGLI